MKQSWAKTLMGVADVLHGRLLGPWKTFLSNVEESRAWQLGASRLPRLKVSCPGSPCCASPSMLFCPPVFVRSSRSRSQGAWGTARAGLVCSSRRRGEAGDCSVLSRKKNPPPRIEGGPFGLTRSHGVLWRGFPCIERLSAVRESKELHLHGVDTLFWVRC